MKPPTAWREARLRIPETGGAWVKENFMGSIIESMGIRALEAAWFAIRTIFMPFVRGGAM
jgi:hypothetical protein